MTLSIGPSGSVIVGVEVPDVPVPVRRLNKDRLETDVDDEAAEDS